MSTLPHRIRLRGPWNRLRQGEASLIALPGPVPEETDEVSRSFGKPTGLTSSDRVWICGSSCEESTEVILNEQLLGPATSLPFDVTELLQERNRVHFRFGEAKESREMGEVYLEIRAVSPPSSVPG